MYSTNHIMNKLLNFILWFGSDRKMLYGGAVGCKRKQRETTKASCTGGVHSGKTKDLVWQLKQMSAELFCRPEKQEKNLWYHRHAAQVFTLIKNYASML